MTDTRLRGFKSRAELEEHLGEISDDAEAIGTAGHVQDDLKDLEREAAWLRKEVSDLRSQLHVVRGVNQPNQEEQASGRHYWRWATAFAIALTLYHFRMRARHRPT